MIRGYLYSLKILIYFSTNQSERTPETMPWKQELMCFAVLVAILSSKSMDLDFCNVNKTVRRANLVYRNTSEHRHCVCNVNHIEPSESKNYTVKSKILRGLSVKKGGYYNLSFIHEGKTKSVINETIGENEELFTSPQVIVTNISLELRDDLRRPKVLRIRLFSGGKKLNIKCMHIPSVDRTETTYVTTTTSSQQPESTKPSQTTQTSTIWDELSSTSQTPRHTVTAEVLPHIADKETESTIPVVVGVVGGLLCIVVGIVVSILILRRRIRRKKDKAAAKPSHDNPMYGAPTSDVLYDVANHLTDKTHEHAYNALNLSSDQNYFCLEGHVENERATSGCPGLDESENCKRKDETEDCYNHSNTEAQNRPRGNNYVNVAARTREDYDHMKPITGLPSEPSSHLSDQDEDTYNHTDQISFHSMDPENCYNHLGQVSVQARANLDDCYNHVGHIPSQGMTNTEECYNHLEQ